MNLCTQPQCQTTIGCICNKNYNTCNGVYTTFSSDSTARQIPTWYQPYNEILLNEAIAFYYPVYDKRNQGIYRDNAIRHAANQAFIIRDYNLHASVLRSALYDLQQCGQLCLR